MILREAHRKTSRLLAHRYFTTTRSLNAADLQIPIPVQSGPVNSMDFLDPVFEPVAEYLTLPVLDSLVSNLGFGTGIFCFAAGLRLLAQPGSG